MNQTTSTLHKKMRHHNQGPQNVADVLALIVGVVARRSGRSVAQAKSSVLEDAMSKHNRRDPRLPDLKPVESKDSLDQIMERARKKMGVKSKWERYGQNAVNGAEQANPEREGEG